VQTNDGGARNAQHQRAMVFDTFRLEGDVEQTGTGLGQCSEKRCGVTRGTKHVHDGTCLFVGFIVRIGNLGTTLLENNFHINLF
jgi:hypothetical protein